MLDANGVAVYPWNHGEVLTAAALNAAVAQSSGAAVSATPPGAPTPGLVWYNSATGTISVWDGAAWQPASYVALAGSTMGGPLVLSGDPTAAAQAATRNYVDTHTTGVFLPLATGGTVAGATTFSAAGTGLAVTNNATVGGTLGLTNQASATNLRMTGNNTLLSNTNTIGWLQMSGFVGGSPSTPVGLVNMTVSDKVTASSAQAGQMVSIVQNIAPNANSATGNRITLNVAQTSIGARQGGSYTYSGINQAAQFTTWGETNVGGTSGTPQGAQTAVGVTSVLSYDSGTSTGCTYFTGNAGMEIDTCTNVGASTLNENSLLLVHLNGHGTQATLDDNAVYVGDQIGVTAGRKAALMIGSPGAQWPLDTAQGAVLQGRIGNNYSTKPSSARFGVDMLQVGFPAFNTTARAGFLTSNGFAVDGLGAVQIGTGYATPSPSGLALDCKGLVGTGTPTVAAGGSGYTVNDLLFDGWGGIYQATTVSGGAVTAVTVFADGNSVARRPYYPVPTPPANPVATTVWSGRGGNGSGCTLNLSWNTTATTLALQPSGGPTTVGGTLSGPMISRTLYATGTLVGNGADTTEDTLQSYTLPAGALANVGDRIRITAGGTFAGSTDSKVARVRFGPSASQASNGTSASATSWEITYDILKTGSNTQTTNSKGLTNNSAITVTSGLATVTDTAAITITVTGVNNTNPVAGSVACRYFVVEYLH
jgi:hypothetical protein